VGSSTGLGNPARGGQKGIQMAATFSVELENGGVGTINLNYLNPANFGIWGNDQLRVFGTKGMAETVDGFRRHSLYLPGRDEFDLPFPEDLASPVYLEHYANYLLNGAPMPTAFEDEMAMTRAMLAIHDAAMTGEWIEVPYPDR
jgi:predicted dehydrogenase